MVNEWKGSLYILQKILDWRESNPPASQCCRFSLQDKSFRIGRIGRFYAPQSRISYKYTVYAQIEHHSWLERKETLFGRTSVSFGKKTSKHTIIFETMPWIVRKWNTYCSKYSNDIWRQILICLYIQPQKVKELSKKKKLFFFLPHNFIFASTAIITWNCHFAFLWR